MKQFQKRILKSIHLDKIENLHEKAVLARGLAAEQLLNLDDARSLNSQQQSIVDFAKDCSARIGEAWRSPDVAEWVIHDL